MGWVQNVENVFVTTIDDVDGWVLAIAKDVEVIPSDIMKGINWLAGQAPAIDVGVQAASVLLKEVIASTPGAAQNATVTAAIADINNVAAGINAFANAANTGTNNVAALVAGYSGYQSAVASTAAAKAAAAAVKGAALTVASAVESAAPPA